MNAFDLFKKEGDLYTPKIDTGQRFMFVGRSGSGKSTAAASFPKPLYVFDVDHRIKGLIPAIQWIGKENFQQIDYEQYSPKDGFEAIDAKLNEFANLAEKRQLKYKTIQFDSLGAFIFMLALDSQKKRGASKKDDGGFKGKVRGKVEFLHPDDYNYVSTALRLTMFNYIYFLNEKGVNVIVSAWLADRWAKAKDAKDYDPPVIVGEKILGPGNAVEEFIGYFDECYKFTHEDDVIPGRPPKYMVEFRSGIAKSAVGLPPGKHNISNASFFETWQNMSKFEVK